MLSSQSDLIRRLRIPGYLVLSLLTVLPLLELAASAWPPNIHFPAWRFTLVGAGATATVNTLLGLFLISAIAIASGDRAVVWFVSIACGLGAALCIIGAGMLPLDALQLRGQVPANNVARYNVAWVLACLKILATGVIFIVLSVNSYRAATGLGAATRGRQKGMPLVVAGGSNRPSSSPSENVAG
jgi:hypothetical protein